VSFNVSGVTPGGSTQATISFPTGLPAGSGNAYIRFNYSTNRFEEYVDASGAPLYSFVDADGDGVFDAVNLTLVDGDPNWDGDGTANGTVVDPGFLASGERAFVGTKRRDVLTGNLLSNTIRGRKGNDWLQGGLGIDNLIGGRGKDRFVYTDAAESTAAQRDSVKVGRGDRFVFSSFDGDSSTDGQQKLSFIGRAAFSGVAGELRATRSVLEADLNGDSLADFAVNLRGNTLITGSNLVI
jgi:Ca2+-binding RTX toxin-like protein